MPPAADSHSACHISEDALCPKCGYSLKGLLQNRCPECGEDFDPTYVLGGDQRVNLLPWERPELGNVLWRYCLTTLQTWLRPGTVFTRAASRRSLPIVRAGRLAACHLSAAIFVHIACYTLTTCVFFIKCLVASGSPGAALDTVLRATTVTAPHEPRIWSELVLLPFVFILISSAMLRWFHRGHLTGITLLGIFALLSPAVVLLQCIIALVGLIISSGVHKLLGGTGGLLLDFLAWAVGAYLVAMIWLFSRRILSGGLLQSFGILVSTVAVGVLGTLAIWLVPFAVRNL